MGKELLFEIGTEEIPSVYMRSMLEALRERAHMALIAERLDFDEVRVCGTPRRLVFHVPSLAEHQTPLSQELLGPPVSAAFDKDGNPTKAATGFAKSNGVEVSDLARKDTDKGERLMYLREEEGDDSKIILVSLLTNLIGEIPSPKSMRWGAGEYTFVRPIQWVLAIFDGRRIHGPLSDFSGSIPRFGNTTRGHRFMAPEEFEVTGYADYLAKLRAHFVEPVVYDIDGGGRIPLVRRDVEQVADEAGADLAADFWSVERLVEKVAFLVEWPVPVLCGFEEKFLDLPEEVIISTLETHQRCFALREKGGGALVPKFVGVSNTAAKDMKVVAQGYERVVRARLEDAEFYWKQDLATPLAEMAEKLKGVVYHPRLGTSWEKVERFRALAAWLAGALFPGDKELAGRVDEAARLCKADLTSGMVYEFPELQGLMGQNYAKLEGIDAEVARAISDHYLPIGEGEEMPSGDAGAIVGLADRMDTLAGMIGLGYVPSGSADPYALRRAANAIIRILIERGYRVSLADFAQKALAPLSEKFKDGPEEAAGRLNDFLRSRAGAYLARSGARGDLVEAVLSASGDTGWHDPADAAARLAAVEKLAERAETFEPLTTTFKRVSNIIRQAEEEGAGEGDFSPDLIEDESERALAGAVDGCAGEVTGLLEGVRGAKGPLEGIYMKIMDRVTVLRPEVDRFFDDVLVMAEDEKLRRNRLALLARVGGLFAPVADFSKIQAASRERAGRIEAD